MSKCIGCIMKGEAKPIMAERPVHAVNVVTQQLVKVGVIEEPVSTRLACACSGNQKGRLFTTKRDNEWQDFWGACVFTPDMQMHRIHELPTH